MWEEGKPQICDVMRYTHQAYNYSDKPLEILFVDIKYHIFYEKISTLFYFTTLSSRFK